MDSLRNDFYFQNSCCIRKQRIQIKKSSLLNVKNNIPDLWMIEKNLIRIWFSFSSEISEDFQKLQIFHLFCFNLCAATFFQVLAE